MSSVSMKPSHSAEKSELDLESQASLQIATPVEDIVSPTIFSSPSTPLAAFLKQLATVGVEMRGLEPIPVERRTHTKYYNIFTLFGGSFISVLPLSIGTTPTLAFGLSFKDAAAMIVTSQFFFVLPTLYILTLAPLLGMRQSVQFRYVFGKYPNAFISLIVILEVLIFGILATVAGAECLSAIRPGNLPIEGSIGIILAIGFGISFIGYPALHMICQYIWIPNSIAFLILIGCAGSSLHIQSAPRTSGIAAPYLATIAICASNMATWGTIVGDYACYMPPHAPRIRLAFYCFMGLYVPFTLMMIVGAAIGGAIGAIPSWEHAYGQGGLGAVLGRILVAKLNGFGHFVLVILGLSVVTTSARDMYSMSLFAVAFMPWLRRIPRIIILLGAAGLMIGVAIASSRSFLSTLSTLVSIAGYMTGPTVCIFLIEWFYFRRADPTSMDPKIWDNAAELPSGIPALISSIVPWALIITSMNTAWYVGPISEHTGDLAYELGTVSAGILYFPLRALEVRCRGRL